MVNYIVKFFISLGIARNQKEGEYMVAIVTVLVLVAGVYIGVRAGTPSQTLTQEQVDASINSMKAMKPMSATQK